jgi:signal transduction histidine kinase
VFVADTLTDAEIAVAVFYVAVILVGVEFLPPRGVGALAGVCVALTVLSLLLTRHGSAGAGLANSAISILAIAFSTYLALRLVAAVDAVHESRGQLARVARLTSLGELTASIAHEVNQPLAAIVTSGHACLRWMDLAPPNLARARQSVERMISDANRASEVVERVRGLASGAAPHKEWLDVNTAVTEAIDLARGELDREGIHLQLNLAKDGPPVWADPIQVQQVIANLVLNSIEAMRSTPRERRELVVSTRWESQNAIVAVADSGIGVSVDTQNRLFDAFWSTKKDGVGIGLTISRSIVEAHGGRIWATPRTNGVLFQFSLPTG